MDLNIQLVINATIGLGTGPDVLSKGATYKDVGCFSFIMTRCGLANEEWKKLIVTEGIRSVKDLVNTFENIDDLQRALHRINDRVASTPVVADRCYFTTFSIKNIMVLHIYVQRCLLVNKIPDIRLIKVSEAVNYLKSKHDDDNMAVPKLTGEGWANFRDKFLHHINNILGYRGIPLNYIIRYDDGSQAGGLDEVFPNIASPDVFPTMRHYPAPNSILTTIAYTNF